MEVDYIIIGQGICGTFLSWFLLQNGKKIHVVDVNQPYTSTKIASGLINPVTGRRIVTTWMIDELLPFAQTAYNYLGNYIGTKIAWQHTILDFHTTMQMKDAFTSREAEGNHYLESVTNEKPWNEYFNFHYGIGAVKSSILIDLQTMLEGWRAHLNKQGNLSEQEFLWADCNISKTEVTYQNIKASRIICCDGISGYDNPYFGKLPFSNVKGEVLIASIPGLPHDFIYKEGITIVPWRDGLFWIGSNYEWDYSDLNPTAKFRKNVETRLKNWLKCKYEIVDHWASARPASVERRPFVGLHPQHPQVGIFNGMGTKGCSLAPYFASQFANFLSGHGTILPEADVQRYKKALSI